MRKALFCIVFLLMMLPLSGCTETVTLHQSSDNVAKIEFLFSPFYQFQVFHTVPENSVMDCMEDIAQLKIHRNGSPADVGGTYIIKITYADGSEESLGTWSVSYVSGGVTDHDGWYCVSAEDLYDLFSKYMEPAQIPTN